MTQFPFPKDHKFAVISVKNVNYRNDTPPVALDLENAKNLSLHFTYPLVMDDWWISYLGKFKKEDFESGNLFIILHAPSAQPHILDKENGDLLRRCDLFLKSMIISGSIYHDGAIEVSGANEQGITDIRHVASHDRSYNSGEFGFDLDKQFIENAARVFEGFLKIEAVKKQTRFRAGINCLLRAGTYRPLEDRVHNYVRAIEALVCKFSNREFASRAKELFNSSQHRDVFPFFKNVYDLRSHVEHFNRIEGTKENMNMALKVMFIANRIYSKILSAPDLMDVFDDDDSLKKFWDLESSKRRKKLVTFLDYDEIESEIKKMTRDDY